MSDHQEDPWAWAHAQPPEAPVVHGASEVLGVMVAHNGSEWLPRALVALARLRTRPGRIIAIDAESTDSSRQLLDRAVNEGVLDACYDGFAAEGFGDNVKLAIQRDESSWPEIFNSDQDAPAQPQWIWLLHDDVEPARNSLSALLRAAHGDDPAAPGGARDTTIPDVIVPKLLHPRLRNHPDQMSALGESIAPQGARVASVEPGDIDQHQMDPGPVLGGSSAGMFIRYSVWDALDGFDPAVPLFRDGVEFGWRANKAGYTVMSCPSAAIYHREAGRIGLRASLIAPDSQITDAVMGMRVVTAHDEHPKAAAGRINRSIMWRVISEIIGKAPSQAGGQIRALKSYRSTRDITAELHHRVQSSPHDATLPAGVLPAKWWTLRHGVDRIAGRVGDAVYEIRNDEAASGIDELTGSDYANVAVARRVFSARLVTIALVVITSLIAARSLIGSGTLVGARLLPAPATLAEAWSSWLHPTAGVAGASSPWLMLTALGSTLTAGRLQWFIVLLLAGSVCFATWIAAHFFARVCGRGWFANGLAIVWALTLPVIGAIGQGSMDLIALGLFLPGLATAFLRWRTKTIRGAEGWRAPSSVGFWTLMIGAFFPLFIPLALIWVVALAIYRKDLRGGLVASLIPLAGIAFWIPGLISQPARILTGIDPTSEVAGRAPGLLATLFGRGMGSTTPWWISIVFVVLVATLGIIGVLRARIRDLDIPTRRVLILIAVGGLLLACGLPRLVVQIGGTPVRPLGAEWYLVAVFACLTLGGFGIGRPLPVHGGVERAQDRPNERLLTGWHRAMAGIIAAAVAVGSLWWVWGGAQGSLQRVSSIVPSYVSAIQDSPRQTRTLLIQIVDGTVSYSITSSGHPRWGDGEYGAISADGQMRSQIASIAQQIAQGTPSDDLADRLAELGIGYVWVSGSSSQALASLDAAPGMTAATSDGNITVWTLDETVSRAVISTNGQETPVAGEIEGTPGSLIVISEPEDSRLEVSVGGQQLTRADSGDWRQGFDLGQASGQLSWGIRPSWVAAIWEVLVIVAGIILAAPASKSRRNAPRRALKTSRRAEPRRLGDPVGFAPTARED